MKTQELIDIEIEFIAGSDNGWDKNRDENNKGFKAKAQREELHSKIQAEVIELRRVSELEKKLVEEEQEENKKEKNNIEDLAEESLFYKGDSYNDCLVQYGSIHEAERPINESFQKANDGYVSEVETWWYIKHRTVTQKLRNVTSIRGLMSYLEYNAGITVVKKVK